MSYIDVDSKPGPDPIPDKPDRPTSKTKKVMQKAKKNNLLACNELGILYLTGTGGLNQSKPKAFMWFETSAKLGCITAMSNAGRTALDVDDMIKAKYWLQKCLDTKWQDDKTGKLTKDAYQLIICPKVRHHMEHVEYALHEGRYAPVKSETKKCGHCCKEQTESFVS